MKPSLQSILEIYPSPPEVSPCAHINDDNDKNTYHKVCISYTQHRYVWFMLLIEDLFTDFSLEMAFQSCDYVVSPT